MFLDLAADRYFCLSPNGERAFTRLVDRQALDAPDLATLRDLSIDGPLVTAATPAAIQPCRSMPVPTISLLDADTISAGPAELAAAALAILAAPMRLRLFGLKRVLAALERRKSRQLRVCGESATQAVARAFKQVRFIATERDNCLTRSLAVATRLIGVGAVPELVIAVKLQPFAAHAWVQCGDRLINDRHEFVREFTPILVV